MSTQTTHRVLSVKEAVCETGLSERELRTLARTGAIRSMIRKPRAPFRFLADHLVEDVAAMSKRGRVR